MTVLSNITYKGDWKKFEKFLSYSWGNELEASIAKATRMNALFLMAEIQRRIDKGMYTPNSPYTIERKGHDRVLIDKGRMIKSLSEHKITPMVREVGFLKDQKASRGNKTLFQIIPMLHDGHTFTIKTSGGTRTIRIPPRPFLGGVWNDPKILAVMYKNWEMAIERVLKKYGQL